MLELWEWRMVNESDRSVSLESELLRAGRAGDSGALERLLAQHERSLLTLCRGILGQAEDAEDAVQETFLRALRALPRFREDASVRTWLFRIAVNVCLDWKSVRRPMAAWSESPPLSLLASPSPEAAVLGQMRVWEALRTLLPRRRALLLLKEREGWSLAEIAAALGWNEKRVQNELYQARRALADWRRRNAAEGDDQ